MKAFSYPQQTLTREPASSVVSKVSAIKRLRDLADHQTPSSVTLRLLMSHTGLNQFDAMALIKSSIGDASPTRPWRIL